jgi:adenylate kinase family enzyme
VNRIMVIGCCGSGKSTFSRKLQALTQLDLFHLDQYYWKPHWVETPKTEWAEIVQNLANKPAWIIDGTYGGTMDIRLKLADTIIYFDYPTWKCLWRVLKRNVNYWGKVRPDMPEGCKERFDLAFLHYVAIFNTIKRKKILAQLDSVKNSKKIIIFKNDKQAETFLLEVGIFPVEP